MSDYAIKTRNLRKTFRSKKGLGKGSPEVKALQGVDFEIKHGENYCLLGPNGAGKTTLIRCILGLIEGEGDIKVLGHTIPDEKDEIITKIGYMPQDISLYPDLSVKETLHFFSKIYGIRDKSDRNEAVKKMYNIFRFNKWKNTVVENLSGGMKRRLSLACALVHDPQLIILDEPTVGVDPNLRLQFWDYFKDLNDGGATIITTTHIMDEAEKSKLIGFMRNGKLIAQGTAYELKKSVKMKRKLIVEFRKDSTEATSEYLQNTYKVKVNEYDKKLEIFYTNESILDKLITYLSEESEISTIRTIGPNLEDTFIYYSDKKEVRPIK